jgi:hypothetical protein
MKNFLLNLINHLLLLRNTTWSYVDISEIKSELEELKEWMKKDFNYQYVNETKNNALRELIRHGFCQWKYIHIKISF